MRGLSVVVVGGGSGLGEVTVGRAVAAGAAAVSVLDLDGAAASAAVRAGADAGLTVTPARCDVRDGAATRRALDHVAAELGHLDTLVNCAAVTHMRGQAPTAGVRGRIVDISSVDAFRAHPQNAHYAATRAAVVSLTRSFAHELAAEGTLGETVIVSGGYLHA